MKSSLSGIDSIVVFQNSQGLASRGTLVHITRTKVVFEVYNPYSIVQLSEVLHGVKVLRGERTIYNGKAVVNNIVPTGLMVIVSASLIDAWSDLSGLRPGKGLHEETQRFVNDWEDTHVLRAPYQLIVGTIRNFLEELSLWLEEAEAGVLDGGDLNRAQRLKNEFFEEVEAPVIPIIGSLYEKFEEEARLVPTEDVMVHKAYARRELHSLTMCSPFVHRTYTKPLGYAGDYEMMNMMLGESDPVDLNTYARIVHSYHIRAAAPEAHRNRIVMLEDRLKMEAKRVTAEGRPFTVLNIACGPALEIQRFIRNEEISNHAVFHLLDFNQETIEYAESRIQEAISDSAHRPMVKFIHKSIDTLLKEVYEKENTNSPTYDMVYCAGLFDYFTDQTCKQLLTLFIDWVRAGGLMTITNVHPKNPDRHQMEHLLEWHLYYRDEEDMRSLLPPNIESNIISDPTKINVFIDYRKEG